MAEDQPNNPEHKRYLMWCSLLGDDYVTANKKEKHHLRVQYCATVGDFISPNQIKPEEVMLKYSGPEGLLELACCPEVAKPAAPCLGTELQRKLKQEKESTMGYNTANANLVVQAAPANPEQESKDYLLRRVSDLYWNKVSPLRAVYFVDEEYPGNGQKMVDRILAGKFTMLTEHPGTEDEYTHISWRDPATPKDEKGYYAAVQRLKDAKQKADDEITVFYPETGLESLREFEKFDATVEAAPTVH